MAMAANACLTPKTSVYVTSGGRCSSAARIRSATLSDCDVECRCCLIVGEHQRSADVPIPRAKARRPGSWARFQREECISHSTAKDPKSDFRSSSVAIRTDSHNRQLTAINEIRESPAYRLVQQLHCARTNSRRSGRLGRFSTECRARSLSAVTAPSSGLIKCTSKTRFEKCLRNPYADSVRVAPGDVIILDYANG